MAATKQDLKGHITAPPRGWFEERLDWARFKEKYLRKPFPVHSSFFLGEIALFSFLILILTGILLAFTYQPSTELIEFDGQKVPAAYASVVQNDRTPFGLLVRQIHHWSAHVMIAAIILHLLRIFFTGLYKKPREINWLVGLTLLFATVFAAFSGYLLPFDEFSVTATGIGYNIVRSMPWVGPALADFIFAGKFPSAATIPRFYAYHVMLLPLILIGLISLHLLIVLKQKHSQLPYARLRVGNHSILGVPLWPHQVLMMAMLFFLLSGILFLMAGFFPVHPVEFYGPPGPATPVVKPDWYLLWPYGVLKLIPGWISLDVGNATINSESMGGVVIPLLIVLLLALLPFIDQAREPVHVLELPGAHPARTAVGVGAIAFFGVLMIASYNEELGLSVGVLQVEALLVPLILGGLTYVGLRVRRERASAG